MLARQKNAQTLGEHRIFGDEEAARVSAELAELRAMVGELSERVHAQFTTISAHAEIARQQVEFVRDEARSDLERTRSMLIELMEHARRDSSTSASHPPLPAPPTGLPVAGDVFENRLGEIADRVEQCFERQRELAATMSALLDTVLSGQADSLSV